MYRIVLLLTVCCFRLFGQPVLEGGIKFSGNYKDTRSLPDSEKTAVALLPYGWFVLVEKFEVEFDISFYDSRSVGTVMRIRSLHGKDFLLTLDSSATPGVSLLTLRGYNGPTGISFPLQHRYFALNRWYRFLLTFYLHDNKIRGAFGREEITADYVLPQDLPSRIYFGAGFNGTSAAFALRNFKIRNHQNTELFSWSFKEADASRFAGKHTVDQIAVQHAEPLLPQYYHWQMIDALTPGVPFSAMSADTAGGKILFTTAAGILALPYRAQQGVALPPTPQNTVQYLQQGGNAVLPAPFVVSDPAPLPPVVFLDSLTGGMYSVTADGNTADGRLIKYRAVPGTIAFTGGHWSPRANPGYFYSGESGVWFLFGGVSPAASVNPRREAYIDLFRLDFRDSSASRIWMLISQQTMYPAQSGGPLYYDRAAQVFYAPVFTQAEALKANAGLVRLARFQVFSPEYTLLGDSVQFASGDLCFYDHQQQAFYIARKTNGGMVQVLRLLAPPLSRQEFNRLNAAEDKLHIVVAFLLYVVCPILTVLGGVFLFSLYKRVKPQGSGTAVMPTSSAYTPSAERTATEPVTEASPYAQRYVTLFGNFSIHTPANAELAGKLTSKPEEMLIALLLACYPVKGSSHGLTDTVMAEYLWPELPEENFANNKKVTLSKLNSFLTSLPGFELQKESGLTRLVVSSPELCDYTRMVQLLRQNRGRVADSTDWQEFLNLTHSGKFLANLHYNWLEQYRIEITERVIEEYFSWIRVYEQNDEFHQVVKLAEVVLQFDALNEDALVFLLSALHHEGKFTQEKAVFEKFASDYRRLFNESYPHTSASLIARRKEK